MRFEFATAGRIVFGAGVLREVGPLAKSFDRRALIVTGRDTQRAEPLNALLSEHNVMPVGFSAVGEPSLETVEQGVALAKAEKCEVVISFGGGSALDAGKAVAAIMTNPGDLIDYVEVIGRGRALAQPSAPFI